MSEFPINKTLLSAPPIYKPFKYPWAFDYWEKQQKLHWMPEEAPLGEDVKDWKNNLTESERHFLTQIFRFFTQADVEVQDCYMAKYSTVFKPIEVKMMLSAFANMETIHIAAYSLLLDTIGMPEIEYSKFLSYKAMKDKHDYLQDFDVDTPYGLALTLAAFGAFTEGMQLFASFVMLLNFQRHNKMKGMGQIVAWSARDESLHCQGIIQLYHALCAENASDIPTEKLHKAIYEIAEVMVSHEDAFIDLAFEMGPMENLTATDVKQYIRYLADRRLLQLGLKPIFGVSKNPLPWVDAILNGVEFTNFFENKPTEYSKASSTGSWDDAYGDL